MNRRQFTQTTALALGSTLAARTLSVAKMDRRAIGLSNHGPGDWQMVPAALSRFDGQPRETTVIVEAWQMVPAALSRFDWHKVIARPRSSPGLTNWCNIDRRPESKQIIISFTEITDPAGTMREDPPRMDFSGLRRTQRFLVSEDRGESWQNLAEHPFENSPDSWQLNGGWERLKFLRNGKIVSFKSEHTQAGRRPMIFYSHSNDTATSWSNWRPMCDNPKRGMFGGDLCQLKDGRWIYFYELYDLNLPSFKCRIRRKPAVWMDRSVSPRRFGCAISEDGGRSWKDRPDLDISMEEEFNRGEPFEPAVVQLKNGNLLVVVRLHRLAGFGGEGLPWRQWILEPTRNGFQVVSNELCPADVPFGPTGHPELIYTQDGILLGVRSDGLWASIDDGKFWEKIDNQYLGYYPQGVELDDGSLLIVGHLGGDNYWPPDRDQEVRLTRLLLDRTPILRNLDRSVSVGYTMDDQSHRDVRVRSRLGTDATAGLLARARVMEGKLSGYVFYVTANKPAWLLGRLENGKMSVISSGKLNGLSLTGVRPRLELAVVGDVVRAFVDTYPVASGRDRAFSEGHAGLVAEGGRVRVESYEVLAPVSLKDIGGETVELVKDLGVISYEQVADNWQTF